jgi:hypothetical protein
MRAANHLRPHRRSLPRSADCAVSNKREPGRRGVIFHYYFAYVLVSSALATTCGIFAHTLLKAEFEDARIADQRRTLMRMESQLRRDSRDAETIQVVDGHLEFKTPESSAAENKAVQWSVRRHVVERTVLSSSASASSTVAESGSEPTPAAQPGPPDRFLFRAGSEIRFLNPDNQPVVVQIEDAPTLPSVRPLTSEEPSATAEPVAEVATEVPTTLTSRRIVEIYLTPKASSVSNDYRSAQDHSPSTVPTGIQNDTLRGSGGQSASGGQS